LVKYNGVHPTTANFVDNPYLMYYWGILWLKN
jgi:hypothetical protein